MRFYALLVVVVVVVVEKSFKVNSTVFSFTKLQM